MGKRLQERLEIGVLRAPEDVRRRAGLGDLAVVDHHHLVGHVGHHAEVVGDHQDRHAELLLELAHEVQNLRLDRDVEGGGGLVGDQQGRAADQRHRQHGPLPQAARQFERIHLVGALRVLEADETEHVLDFVVLLALGHFAVQHQRLADLVADAVDRRERGHRLLEDHADAAAAQRPDLRPVPSQTRDVDRRLVAAGDPRTGSVRPRTRPLRGSRPITHWEMTVLPDPDSPTSATVFPAGTRKLTPFTTSAAPPCMAKPMRRSSTRRMSGEAVRAGVVGMECSRE